MGVLQQLYAATADTVQGAEYYGPDGFSKVHDYPKRVRSSQSSYDLVTARRLWDVSEELTGVKYPL
jgi:hypothetical protein